MKAQLKCGSGDSDKDCTWLSELVFLAMAQHLLCSRENHIPPSSLGQKYLCIQLSKSMHHPRSRRTQSKRFSLHTKENLANYLITTSQLPPVFYPPWEAGLHTTGIIFSTSKWTNMWITISGMLFHFPSQDTFASSTNEMFLVFVWLLIQHCTSLGSSYTKHLFVDSNVHAHGYGRVWFSLPIPISSLWLKEILKLPEVSTVKQSYRAGFVL